MTVVFRFRTWDIANDCYRNSQRWATKEAIARVMGEAISEGVEVDDQDVGGEVDDMTARNFRESSASGGLPHLGQALLANALRPSTCGDKSLMRVAASRETAAFCTNLTATLSQWPGRRSKG
jgi:hypothetical protein